MFLRPILLQSGWQENGIVAIVLHHSHCITCYEVLTAFILINITGNCMNLAISLPRIEGFVLPRQWLIMYQSNWLCNLSTTACTEFWFGQAQETENQDEVVAVRIYWSTYRCGVRTVNFAVARDIYRRAHQLKRLPVMRLLALVYMASSSGVGPLKMVAEPGPSTITLQWRVCMHYNGQNYTHTHTNTHNYRLPEQYYDDVTMM